MKVKDICDSVTDGSHNPPKGVENSDYMMLSSKNVFDDEITFDEPRFLSESDFIKENERTNVTANDVLLTIVGTVGRTAVVEKRMPTFTLQRSVAVLHPKKNICSSRFLMYALRGKRSYIENRARGVAQKGIYLREVAEIEINLPNLKEQNEIVKKLDKVHILIKLKVKQLQYLDELIKARFVELFGDPVHSDKYSTRKLLSCVADKADMVDGPFGSQVNTKVDYIEDGEIPVIRTVNVKMMSFSPVDLKFMKREKYETVIRSQVLPGDVILTKVGTIGNVCIFPDSFEEAVLSTTGSCRIRVDNSIVNTVFFAYNLMYLKGKLLEIASAGVQPFLNMNHVKNIDVLDVPLDKQIEFSDFVHQVDKSKVAVQASLDQAQILFDSLMQKYFG